MKSYRVSVEALMGATADKYREMEDGKVFTETLQDEETLEKFKAEVMFSKTPKPGYDELFLVTERGIPIKGGYIKILRKIEEEEPSEITRFESRRLSERKGYMLKSMLREMEAEESKKTREELRKEIMTTELERRLKEKKEKLKL